jgi:hypothetical protein
VTSTYHRAEFCTRRQAVGNHIVQRGNLPLRDKMSSTRAVRALEAASQRHSITIVLGYCVSDLSWIHAIPCHAWNPISVVVYRKCKRFKLEMESHSTCIQV